MTPLHHGQYVHLDVLPTGGLRITLTPEGMDETVNNRFKDAHDDDVFADLFNEDFEGTCTLSGLAFTTADLVPGNLSQAPMILEDAEWIGCPEIDYQWQTDARTWYWADYQVISILEHIKRQGEAVLTLLT